MLAKRFVPCIYLYHCQAVRHQRDLSVAEADPLRLVQLYNENGADGLLVFDLSEGEQEREEALDLIREICSVAEMEVTGAGRMRRLEDVKKMLYAGCKWAVLDSSPEGMALMEEASLRFGRDRLLVSCGRAGDLAESRERLERCVSGLILLDPHQIRETERVTELPFLVQIDQIALNKLLELFAHGNVCGITGNAVNDNYRDIQALKGLCRENGIPLDGSEALLQWADLRKNSDGLVPAVVQDCRTGEVLMVAYMDEEAYCQTLRTGRMTYFSRSRRKLWLKGETSGHFQYLKSLSADCDRDTLLAKVSQTGPACHTGARSCFFNEIVRKEQEEAATNPLQVFEKVYDVIKDRKLHPKEGSYTNYLFDKGIDKILKKLGEEATEIVIAAKNPGASEVKYEISDFLYHMMVLMAEKGISWEEITAELARR